MSSFLGTLDSALGGVSTGALVITVVFVVLLALGGVVVIAYLLLPSVRHRLDRWMNQQEGDIWTDTLAFVDAEREKYRRPHRTAPLGRTDGDTRHEPVFRQEEPMRVKSRAHEQHLHEMVE